MPQGLPDQMHDRHCPARAGGATLSGMGQSDGGGRR